MKRKASAEDKDVAEPKGHAGNKGQARDRACRQACLGVDPVADRACRDQREAERECNRVARKRGEGGGLVAHAGAELEQGKAIIAGQREKRKACQEERGSDLAKTCFSHRLPQRAEAQRRNSPAKDIDREGCDRQAQANGNHCPALRLKTLWGAPKRLWAGLPAEAKTAAFALRARWEKPTPGSCLFFGPGIRCSNACACLLLPAPGRRTGSSSRPGLWSVIYVWATPRA